MKIILATIINKYTTTTTTAAATITSNNNNKKIRPFIKRHISVQSEQHHFKWLQRCANPPQNCPWQCK